MNPELTEGGGAGGLLCSRGKALPRTGAEEKSPVSGSCASRNGEEKLEDERIAGARLEETSADWKLKLNLGRMEGALVVVVVGAYFSTC